MPRRTQAPARQQARQPVPRRRMTTRRCRCCGELKAERAFERADQYRRRVCRKCRRDNGRVYYRANKPRYRAANARRIAAAQSLVAARLSASPCVTCGEADIVCLEFHHVAEKEFTVSELIFARRRSLAAVTKEMDRCVVMCGNCHRRSTAALGRWTLHRVSGVPVPTVPMMGAPT